MGKNGIEIIRLIEKVRCRSIMAGAATPTTTEVINRIRVAGSHHTTRAKVEDTRVMALGSHPSKISRSGVASSSSSTDLHSSKDLHSRTEVIRLPSSAQVILVVLSGPTSTPGRLSQLELVVEVALLTWTAVTTRGPGLTPSAWASRIRLDPEAADSHRALAKVVK